MITTVILNIFYVFVLGIVSLLSSFGDVQVSGSIASGIDAMKPYYVALDPILPMATILGIIAFEIVVDTAILTYRLIKWGYQKVPGIN